MLLHRYLGSHAFETLNEAKFKTSRITAFNDPFEFLFITKGRLTAQQARKYVTARWNDPEFQKTIQNVIGPRTPLPVAVAYLVQNQDGMLQAPFEKREEMADLSTRIVCFSNSSIDPLDEILLWSHYGKHHEGVH